MNIAILDVLQREGLIRGFTVEGNRVNVLLKRYLGAPVIRNITVVSRPSRSIYMNPQEIKSRTSFNSGLWLVSTSKGILTHRETIELGLAGSPIFGINTGSQKWV